MNFSLSRLEMSQTGVEITFGDLRRFPHADDPDQIFGSRPLVVFLDPAVQKRKYPGSATNIQSPDAAGSVKSIGGQAQKINAELLNIDGHNPDRIDGIRMKYHLFTAGDPCNFLYRLNRAGFVVAVHN